MSNETQCHIKSKNVVICMTYSSSAVIQTKSVKYEKFHMHYNDQRDDMYIIL